MATSDKEESRKVDAQTIYNSLIAGDFTSPINYATPKPGLEEKISEIYTQAHQHRELLIRFFIGYTIAFSSFVCFVVVLQIRERIIYQRYDVEIVPEWVLYLLVVGIFGQFISLLTIVTRKVWTFEPFLDHPKKERE